MPNSPAPSPAPVSPLLAGSPTYQMATDQLLQVAVHFMTLRYGCARPLAEPNLNAGFRQYSSAV